MLPFEKEYVEKENAKLIEIRKEFYNYLDNNIPKDKDGNFDFSNNPKLNAKDVYERFFKLDYQARKLRALLVQTYDLKAE
jgi:hypothetical protein